MVVFDVSSIVSKNRNVSDEKLLSITICEFEYDLISSVITSCRESEKIATTYIGDLFLSGYDIHQNRIPIKSANQEHKRSAQKSSLERAHIPTWLGGPLLCFIYHGPKGHHIDFHTCTQVGNQVMKYSLYMHHYLQFKVSISKM